MKAVAATTIVWKDTVTLGTEDAPKKTAALYAPDAVLWGTVSEEVRETPEQIYDYFVSGGSVPIFGAVGLFVCSVSGILACGSWLVAAPEVLIDAGRNARGRECTPSPLPPCCGRHALPSPRSRGVRCSGLCWSTTLRLVLPPSGNAGVSFQPLHTLRSPYP